VQFLRPDRTAGRSRRRHRRRDVPAAAARLLATSVDAAVPLQRHPPSLVLGVSLLELLAVGSLIATGSPVAMGLLLVCSVILLAVMFTNTRRVLAMTTKGNVLLTASTSGWPNGVVGPADRSLVLPRPSGLGVAVRLGTASWWIDRSSYRSLNRARSFQDAGTAG
jgi:hypothetical protein